MKVIDLFAGAGGFTTGATQAGARVVWAANHCPTAVATHAANHPDTQHVCQDLHQADWTKVPAHDLVLASPACQGHSRARGRDASYHDDLRSTAWAVVSCLETHRAPYAVIENVPDFAAWSLFPAWKYALEILGYTLTTQVLNAADFGVPQSRDRLFIVASRNGAVDLVAPELNHQSAMSVIDWDSGDWGTIARTRTGRSRAESSRLQIRNGRKRWGRRFYMAYYGSEKCGRDPNKPLGTVTTRDTFAAVDGNRVRMLSIDECRAAMGFDRDYQLPTRHVDAMKMLGNAVVPAVACSIVQQINNQRRK